MQLRGAPPMAGSGFQSGTQEDLVAGVGEIECRDPCGPLVTARGGSVEPLIRLSRLSGKPAAKG